MRSYTIELPQEVSPELVPAYCRFVQLETWTRELVYVELKAHYGPDWWSEAQAALKRAKGAGIPAERSLRADRRHPHMATPENDPLWFISFDSLFKIVLDRKLWKLFYPYLTTKSLLRAKFQEISPIRNRVAHCRRLHSDDVARLEAVMRDVDQGFWRFCTSYNQRWRVSNTDPVWAQLRDNPLPSRVTVDIELSRRPTSKQPKQSRPVRPKGALYNVLFFGPQEHALMDYREILKWTRPLHGSIVHILLQSDQRLLRVTVPALDGTDAIVRIVREFHDACRNSTTLIPYYRPHRKHRGKNAFRDQYYESNRAFDLVAAEWPHYVIPPGNPLTFLTPDCPCSFFGV